MHMTRRYLIRIENTADGLEEWVEVEPEVARVMAAAEPRLKERLLRKPKAIEGATEELARYWGAAGHLWEGPRFRFDWLMGESACWSGPESVWLWHSGLGLWVCRFCGHLVALPDIAYCIGCDRSGLDARIESPTKADLAKRVEGRKVYTPPDGLKGGRA